jgi:hypothetical protein
MAYNFYAVAEEIDEETGDNQKHWFYTSSK